MPEIVSVYRTYKNSEGQTVTEENRLYSVDAREAVKYGKGEWSMTAPKGAEIAEGGTKIELTPAVTPKSRRSSA